MKFVLVDIGSSFLKTAIGDSADLTLDSMQRAAVRHRLPSSPGRHELDAQAIADDVRRLIDRQLAVCPTAGGVLLTGQMGGLVVVDERGRPTAPAISWQDTRTIKSGTFETLRQQLGHRIGSHLGNEFQPGLTLPLLFDACRQSSPPQGTVCGLPDAVVASLVGRRPQMERSAAAGLILPATGAIASELVDLPLTHQAWPELVRFPCRSGTLTHRNSQVPVYAATGDHPTALVGGLLCARELSVNVATGSQISMLAGTTPPPLLQGQTRPFFDDSWLATVTNIPAGRAVAAVLNLLTELRRTASDESSPDTVNAADWRSFLQAAESVDATEVKAELGLFPGAIDMPGSLTGLTESCLTVGHVARACLESLASQYQSLFPRIASVAQPQRLLFSGGLIRESRLLQQLIGDDFDLPFRTAPSTEDALLGLTVLGKVVSGECACVADAVSAARHQLKIDAG